MILIIVAHPDDESLWFSGGIKFFLDKNIPFAVISLTNQSNARRREEFFRLIETIGVSGYMLNLPDGATVDWSYSDLVCELLNLIEAHSLSCSGIITHSFFGEERAHRQHKSAHNILRAFAAKSKIPFGFFSCHSLWSGKVVGERLLSNISSKRLSYVRLKKLGRAFFNAFSEVLLQIKYGRLRRKIFSVDPIFLERCLACYPSQFQKPYAYKWINSRVNLMYGDKKMIDSIVAN